MTFFALITLIERQPGCKFQQIFSLLASMKHHLADGPVLERLTGTFSPVIGMPLKKETK